ncbi:MAG TPA: hypothetical protein VG095_06540, partial [Chthoniobacterales bacterium]|nr:hypothetical protein [Chthoniobacterales bacterium]
MPDGFLTALGAILSALFLLGAIYIYLALARQVAARPTDDDAPPERTFGLADAILAIALATFFGLNAAASATQERETVLRTNDLIFNGLLSAAIFVFIVAFLTIRRRDVNLLGGFSRLGFGRTFLTGAILLFAAYPLISIADVVSQTVLGGGTSRQGIVELFNNSQALQQRVLIIVLAIAVAPV